MAAAAARATDQFVRDLLRDIGVTRPWEQDGGPKWKRNALAGGSKSKTGKAEGKPEFVFVVDGFIVIVENKKEARFTRFLVEGQVTTEFPYRQDFALNGAVHYASAMTRNGGDEHHHEIAVLYIGAGIPCRLNRMANSIRVGRTHTPNRLAERFLTVRRTD